MFLILLLSNSLSQKKKTHLLNEVDTLDITGIEEDVDNKFGNTEH